MSEPNENQSNYIFSKRCKASKKAPGPKQTDFGKSTRNHSKSEVNNDLKNVFELNDETDEECESTFKNVHDIARKACFMLLIKHYIN